MKLVQSGRNLEQSVKLWVKQLKNYATAQIAVISFIQSINHLYQLKHQFRYNIAGSDKFGDSPFRHQVIQTMQKNQKWFFRLSTQYLGFYN